MKFLALIALYSLTASQLANAQSPQGTILLVKPSATSLGHAKQISLIEQVNGELRVWSGPENGRRLLIRIDLIEPEYSNSLRNALTAGGVLDVSVCFGRKGNTVTAAYVDYEDLTYVKKHTWLRCSAAPSGSFTYTTQALSPALYHPIEEFLDILTPPFLFTVQGNRVSEYFQRGPFVRR